MYGKLRHVPVREDHPLAPLTAYGASKAAVELYLNHYRAVYGLDCRVARLANPYGAGQDLARGQGAATTFLHRALTGRAIDIWGDGEVVRDYIHISDAAAGLVASHALQQTDGPLDLQHRQRSGRQPERDCRGVGGADRPNVGGSSRSRKTVRRTNQRSRRDARADRPGLVAPPVLPGGYGPYPPGPRAAGRDFSARLSERPKTGPSGVGSVAESAAVSRLRVEELKHLGEIFKRVVPDTPLEWTGERLTTATAGQVEIEHLHRYFLARALCRGRDVLDVASGEGYGTALLAQTALSVIGVEVSAEAVAHAAEAYRQPNLRFLEGDARRLPLDDASVDAVVSFETIEHLYEHDQFLAEVRRVLRPGGRFIISSPERDIYSPSGSSANPYHVRELTRAEFSALLRDSFAHVRLLGQRPMLGSVLVSEGDGARPIADVRETRTVSFRSRERIAATRVSRRRRLRSASRRRAGFALH